MAGKKGMHTKPLHPARVEEIREKIKSTLIIKKLENHILDDVEMTTSQVTAALGLLRKSVPDLSAVELSGTGDDGEHIITFKWQG
jgi:predicted regulator of amino acid metabolism with ACT domain